MALPIFDNKSKGSTEYGGSVTSSHTIGSGSNKLLIAQCEIPSLSDKVSSVTYNGVALSRFRRSGNPGVSTVYTYYLLNPPSGAANVVWTFTSADCRASCINHSWSGVDQTTPLTFLSELIDSTSNSDSRTFTLGASSVALDFIGTNETGRATFTPGSGQTLIDGVIQNGQTVYEAVASYASGVSNVSDSWTDGLRSIGHVAIAINGTASAVTGPTMTGTINTSAVTSSGLTASWTAATGGSNPIGGYQISVDTGTPNWNSIGNVTTYNVTGLNPSTAYTVRVRAFDNAGTPNYSNVLTANVSTIASSSVPPTMNGLLTTSGVTSTGVTLTWNAATQGTNAITGYQYSIDTGTANWQEAGNVTTVTANTLSAGTLYTARVRAHDGSGNYATPISAQFTTSSVASYVDMTNEKCDNIQSGLLPNLGLTAVVFRRDDLTVAKQVVTGITTNADSTVPRFQVNYPLNTPVHIVFINAADNTATGIVSDHATVA
jgi:hypothetical protein